MIFIVGAEDVRSRSNHLALHTRAKMLYDYSDDLFAEPVVGDDLIHGAANYGLLVLR